MPKLKGLAAIQESGERKSGRAAEAFTPLMSMKSGDEAYIAFVTRAEDIEEVWLHTFVKVPNAKFKNGYGFEVFASRSRNPEWNDTESLLEKKPIDHWPVNKVAAITVDLEPVYDGKGTALKNLKAFNVVGREYENDNGTVFYPQWKLIHEPKSTFWAEAAVIHDDNDETINGMPIRIKKGDKGAWSFKELNVPILFDGEEIDLDSPDNPVTKMVPTVSDEIKRLGSRERYEHFFGESAEILPQDQKYRPPIFYKENPDVENPNDFGDSNTSKPATKAKTEKAGVDDLDSLLSDYGADEQETKEKEDTY